MLKKSLFYSLALLLVFPVYADDCLTYKYSPDVDISVPEWKKEVVQPLKPMDLWHGNVAATIYENYELGVETTFIEDGVCVSLKSVSAIIGYSDFFVQIDSRHTPNTCAYNVILSHEDEHIRTYLSVIEDYKKEIEKAVISASGSVMPVFVSSEKDIEAAIDSLNKSVQQHPDIVLIRQKIAAEQEIRNKRIDQQDDGSRLRMCF